MLAILRRPWFWLVILGVLAAGSAGAFVVNQSKTKKSEAAAAAAAKPLETPYAAIANGKADVEGGIIAVAARRGGIVRAVYVQEGDEVRQGQILARQEDDESRLAMQRARAELAQSQAQIAAIHVQIDTAKRELDRMERLQATNFLAGQRLDTARDAVRAAEAAMGQQRAAIESARARLNEAAYNVELTVIRAPSDGRIVRRYANPGSGASTLNVSNMFDLEPKAPRIVRAEITEAAIPAVSLGQEVEIVPEADETRVFTGKVLRRAPVFGARKLQSDDPSERSDERVVEVVVTADGAPLLIGQRVLVKFMKPGRRAGATPPAAPATPAGVAQRT